MSKFTIKLPHTHRPVHFVPCGTDETNHWNLKYAILTSHVVYLSFIGILIHTTDCYMYICPILLTMWDTWDCPMESHMVPRVAWIPCALSILLSQMGYVDCPIQSHVYKCCLNPMCPPFATVKCWAHACNCPYPTYTSVPWITHVRPMLQSNVGHVGLSNNGIQRVPMSLESHVSVLSYCHMWDTWDSQMESGMY